jgi:hypothetical protein
MIAEIGPLLPPAATGGPPSGEAEGFLHAKELKFLAASEDFSDVFFDLLDGHEEGTSWPGDNTTGTRSLYEYSGRGLTHPELVGVNDEGQLISTCATYLGSREEAELYNAVSADGASVAFTARACSNHVGEPKVNELYVRLGGFPINTVPISEPTISACEECQTAVASAKHPAVTPASAEFAGASEDGSNVFFLTDQELLLGDVGENLYDYDFANPEGHKILRVAMGSASPAVQGVARVSEDGSHVYFVAQGRLTKGPREGPEGACLTELAPAELAAEEAAQVQEEQEETVTTSARCRPRSGADNLYVFERDASYPSGRVAFIATLCTGEDASGTRNDIGQCPSPDLSDAQDWGRGDEREVQATPDGRFLVFASVGDLTNDGASEVPQIFEYDAATEALVRVSRGANNYEPEGTESADTDESRIPEKSYSDQDVSPAGVATGLAVSSDGSTVVFESGAALTAEAHGIGNIYEYRSTVGSGGAIGDGNVYLISDGVDGRAPALVGMDASSVDVFFATADRLVPQDTDSLFDVYDARVDGGFSSADPNATCEACEAAPFVQSLENGTSADSGAPTGVSEPVEGSRSPLDKTRVLAVADRARELSRALKRCDGKTKAARKRCEALARKRYGPRGELPRLERRGER